MHVHAGRLFTYAKEDFAEQNGGKYSNLDTVK